jgi:hypothetical protein
VLVWSIDLLSSYGISRYWLGLGGTKNGRETSTWKRAQRILVQVYCALGSYIRGVFLLDHCIYRNYTRKTYQGSQTIKEIYMMFRDKLIPLLNVLLKLFAHSFQTHTHLMKTNMLIIIIYLKK